MAGPRESAFLPTIKCSSCGLQVEISLMGEHLCPGPSVELSPPPESDEKFGDPPFNLPPFERHGRLPTPVDTGAEYGTYMNQGQLSPVSQYGGSRSVSPISPDRLPGDGQSYDYFASGPAQGNDSTPSPPQSHRPGGYGGLEAAAVVPAPAPGRPMGENLLKKLNNIAPGPFDAHRRPSASKNAFPVRKDSLTKWDGPFLEEPASFIDQLGTSNSNVSTGGNGGLTTPRQPKKDGYEGFGPPSGAGDRELEPSAFAHMPRSETFPKPTVSTAEPSRRPSFPSPQDERRPPIGPDTSRRPPPRTSLMPQRLPTGSVDLAAEFGVSNPYHTPSGSDSSGYSAFSGQSQTTSHTSPARSDGREKTPDALKVNIMGNLQISTERLRPTDLRIDSTSHVPPPAWSPMPVSPYAISPSDDRYDPAIQNGLGQGQYRAYRPPTPSSRNDTLPQPEKTLAPGVEISSGRATPPSRKASRDPASQTSRGDCKSCGQPITGKSVSSADGRLTGRYHKACFVCTTCSGPFTSAEFYVLDDKPYCEVHYHKLNGTLCGGCGRGIEGQYVEDESRIKHHVECFSCLDCGRSLSSGYFEVDGKAYCERDALRRTQPSPFAPGGGMPGESGPYPPGPQRGGFGGPGPRPSGSPPRRPGGPGGPGGPGPRPGFSPPGVQRGQYSEPSPGRPEPGTDPKPQMNKRMTRMGMM